MASTDTDTDDDGSSLLHFGTTVGVAFVVAVVGTAPAALRVAKGIPSAGLFSVWAVLGAAALVPSVFLVAIFRGARRGGRSFLDGRAKTHGIRLFTLGALGLPLVVTFGAVLRAKTHHHALAGVTFAVGITVALLAIFAFATRVSLLVEARGERAARWGFGVAFGLFLLAIVWVGLKASGAGGPAMGAFLDTLALLLAAGFGSRRSFADLRPVAVVGPPLAAAMLALGVTTGRELAEPMAQVRGEVALYAPVVDRFAGR